MVILNEGRSSDRWRQYRRKLKKAKKIGVLGALNGIRMRDWYQADLLKYLDLRPIDQICVEEGIRFEKTPWISSERTRELFHESGANLGLSLGNGYIPRSVYEIPAEGMLNVHHALLPRYRNAQSVLWEIFERERNIGFTIHRIDDVIDHGEVVARQSIPLHLRWTLSDTVTFNYARLVVRSADGMVDVLRDWNILKAATEPQGEGRKFTTPSFCEFLSIVKTFRALRREARNE